MLHRTYARRHAPDSTTIENDLGGGSLRLRLLATVVVFGAIAGACTNPSTIEGETASASQSGESYLVLRIDVSGGLRELTPGGFLVPEFPTLSLYADGRVMRQGLPSYPPPALPPLFVQTVDADGIRKILDAAEGAGLTTDTSYTDPGGSVIANAPTTTFTLSDEGQSHTVSVYALAELSGGDAGLSEAEVDARRALRGFFLEMADLRSFLPEGSISEPQPYMADTVRVYVSAYDLDVPGDVGPLEPVDWPGTQPLATFGDPVTNRVAGERCGTVTGDDLSALAPREPTCSRRGGAAARTTSSSSARSFPANAAAERRRHLVCENPASFTRESLASKVARSRWGLASLQ